MGRSTKASSASAPEQAPGGKNLGSYVYGIVLAETKVAPGRRGLGDPAGEVKLVEHGRIAALVSDVDVHRPLDRADDLRTHEELLDEMAAKGPVLPFRFGAVLANPGSVVTELLAPHHDAYLAKLGDLRGSAEYVVEGRYDERAVLAEILAESPEAVRLRAAVHGTSEDATGPERARLDEIVTASIEAKRDLDTLLLLDGLSGHYTRAALLDPSDERDAVHVALLAEADDREGLERALTEFGERWEGRVELRLLGPMAPYDFVTV
ncbi:hypothetical protein GCM10022224_101130 [Nonomuraea antimicrobica]|uniref:Gas vesicle synthesis protein GvpL/GvpF n=1 Tax=Nonomuraea antimicrobica TaxID=561173 RepID=A0ABP7EII9_9ACTN